MPLKTKTLSIRPKRLRHVKIKIIKLWRKTNKVDHSYVLLPIRSLKILITVLGNDLIRYTKLNGDGNTRYVISVRTGKKELAV